MTGSPAMTRDTCCCSVVSQPSAARRKLATSMRRSREKLMLSSSRDNKRTIFRHLRSGDTQRRCRCGDGLERIPCGMPMPKSRHSRQAKGCRCGSCVDVFPRCVDRWQEIKCNMRTALGRMTDSTTELIYDRETWAHRGSKTNPPRRAQA